MRRLVCGVVGHVDHGKTALVRAMTGMETDRLEEEQRRGISIALGFAHFREGDAEVDLIDMPGHERFVRTMVAGATGIDAVLLVVAATEGIKPQTVEHVDVAGLLGIGRGLVVVSKADLVPEAESAVVGEAARGLLAAAGIAAGPAVLTDAIRGVGVEAVRVGLAGLAVDGPRAGDGVVYLPIDRAFSVAGHGTVVTGTLRGAALAAGDELDVAPGGVRVRVRGVQVHGSRVAHGEPGQRVAVNLRDVEPSQVRRGAALAAAGALGASAWLSVRLRAVAGAAPLRNSSRVRALLGTAEFDARVRLLDREVLEPGEEGLAQLHCAEPVAAPAREHVILRLPSPARTVAGGMILEAETARRRRHAPGVLRRLEGLATLPAAEVLRQELAAAGAGGSTLAHLSRLTALAPSVVAGMLQAMPVVIGRGQVAVERAAFEALLGRIPGVLGEGGLTRERLEAALGVSGPVLDDALRRLTEVRSIRLTGGVYAVPRPEREAAARSAEAQAGAGMLRALREAGLSPPNAMTLAPEPGGKRVLERLVKAGEVVRTHDRVQKRDVLFHAEAVAEAQARLRLLLQSGGLTVSEIGAALGISRKFSVPLLEHLDAVGFTRRVGDKRVIAAGSRAQAGHP